MTSILTSTEFETHLQWQGAQQGQLTTEQAPAVPLAGMQGGHPPVDRWAPEELLVGAVESCTLVAFLEQARAQSLEILFYQSSALGRRVEGPQCRPHFTDLIVRPHVAVRGEADAERVLRIFAQLPDEIFPSSILRLTPRIEPVVEIWENPHHTRPSVPSPAKWRPASVASHGS
jgi:organic hydroperoxide reductase OsmC/OhrA